MELENSTEMQMLYPDNRALLTTAGTLKEGVHIEMRCVTKELVDEF